MFNILQFAFMQRALLAGVILAFLLSLLGIFMVLKKMSFFGEGVAHASLAGIAIGILAAFNPVITALVFGTVFALLMYFLERKTKISIDAIIGILFTGSMALGIILINLKKGYQPELLSFLFGNILTISKNDLLIILILSVIIGVFVLSYFNPLTLLTFDWESAYLKGINTTFLEIGYYVALSMAVILGVKLLGIILVSVLLIIPPSIAKIIAPSFKKMVILSIVIGEITVISGLIVSYILNLPSGPVIVLVGAGLFLLLGFLKEISKLLKIKKL